jgi:hypothetical protein
MKVASTKVVIGESPRRQIKVWIAEMVAGVGFEQRLQDYERCEFPGCSTPQSVNRLGPATDIQGINSLGYHHPRVHAGLRWTIVPAAMKR